MYLEGIILSEISQRKTNAIWPHLYVELDKQNKNRLIDTEKKWVVARRGRRWGSEIGKQE